MDKKIGITKSVELGNFAGYDVEIFRNQNEYTDSILSIRFSKDGKTVFHATWEIFEDANKKMCSFLANLEKWDMETIDCVIGNCYPCHDFKLMVNDGGVTVCQCTNENDISVGFSGFNPTMEEVELLISKIGDGIHELFDIPVTFAKK